MSPSVVLVGELVLGGELLLAGSSLSHELRLFEGEEEAAVLLQALEDSLLMAADKVQKG